jgi:hypothetical protein
MSKEVPDTLKLYLDGKIDQFWFCEDQPGVVFLLNAASVEAARSMVEALPLVTNGYFAYEYIPVGPLKQLRSAHWAPSTQVIRRGLPTCSPPALPSQPERNVVRGGASEENKRLFHPSWDDPETKSSTVRCALKKPGVFLSHFPGAQLSCLSPPLLHEWLPTEREKRGRQVGNPKASSDLSQESSIFCFKDSYSCSRKFSLPEPYFITQKGFSIEYIFCSYS